MERIIKTMEDKHFRASLALVEDAFAKWENKAEGKAVRRIVVRVN